MSTVSSCRSGRGLSRAAKLAAPLLALALVTAGCSPTGEAPSAGDVSPSPEPTATWTPPADPGAEGPTEAPVLPEQSGTLDERITLSTAMTVAVEGITTTEITPETPGEYAGTAVVVTVSVTNESERAQSIDSAVVTLVTDDGEIGVATTAGPNAPLQGELAAGERAEGTYVFMLDPAQGRAVTIGVNYAAGEPIANFAGRIS